MYLKNLYLHSFRNYIEQQVYFTEQKTILVGNNAQGKTNLLEAIEILSTLKSHRVSRDRDLVQEGENSGVIKATLKRLYGEQEMSIILRQQGAKTITLNHENLRRHLDLLGILNTVTFSSLDLDLVRGSPEIRRNWIDSLLMQLEPIYAHILHQYNQILKQRNALLKKNRQREHNPPDISQLTNNNNTPIELEQLQLWDEQLAVAGAKVTRRRARILNRITPIAQQWHSRISGKTETLEIVYKPNVNWTEDSPEKVQQAFLEKMSQRRIAEQQLGTSVVGTHRDEIEFTINETLAKSYGSQGQQRTLVLALKLAELQLIEEITNEAPILLLDDVLAELDMHRQNQLLEAIQNRCQTLITTTHLNSFDSQWLKSAQILQVEAGQINDF